MFIQWSIWWCIYQICKQNVKNLILQESPPKKIPTNTTHTSSRFSHKNTPHVEFLSPRVFSTLFWMRDCDCSRPRTRAPKTPGPRTNVPAAGTPNECCQSGSCRGGGSCGNRPRARAGDWTHPRCGTSPGTLRCGTGGVGRTVGRWIGRSGCSARAPPCSRIPGH